jgi:hypothetical protein
VDLVVMSDGGKLHMISSRAIQWSRLIGDVHLLCVLNFLHGVLIILGHYILQVQQLIFSQNGFLQGLYTENHGVKKGIGLINKLDTGMTLYFMLMVRGQSREVQINVEDTVLMQKITKVVATSCGCR